MIIASTATFGVASSGDRCRECGRLLVPWNLLGFEEVLDPADIEPQTVVLEHVNGHFLLQHLEHQIVEAEWNTRRDAFEHCGIHTVDAHAYEIRQLRLLAKSCDASLGLVDHTKIHFRDASSSGNGDSRGMSPMKAHKMVEVEIRKHVAVKNQK